MSGLSGANLIKRYARFQEFAATFLPGTKHARPQTPARPPPGPIRTGGGERTKNRHIDESPPATKERKNAGKNRPTDGRRQKRRSPLSHLFNPQRTGEPFSCKKRQTLFPEQGSAPNRDAMPASKQALDLAQHPMDLGQHPMDLPPEGLHFCLQNVEIEPISH